MSKKISFFDLGLYAGGVTSMFLQLMNTLKINNYNVYGFEPCRIFYEACERRFHSPQFFSANDLINSDPTIAEKINFLHCAISNKDGFIKLYNSLNGVGSSIFETKNKKLDSGIVYEYENKKEIHLNFPSFLKYYPDLVASYLYRRGYVLLSYEPGQYDDKHVCLIDEHLIEAVSSHNPIEYEKVQSILFSNWLKNNVSDLENSINILKVNIEGAEIHLFKDLVDSGLIKHFDVFCGTGDDVEKTPELSHRVEEYKNLLKDNDITIHRFSDWKPERNVDMKQMIEELL